MPVPDRVRWLGLGARVSRWDGGRDTSRWSPLFGRWISFLSSMLGFRVDVALVLEFVVGLRMAISRRSERDCKLRGPQRL